MTNAVLTTRQAEPARHSSSPRASLSENVLFGLLVVSAAVVPCVFTTTQQDVFYLPKLVVLWVVLALVVWVVVLSLATGGSGGRRRLRVVWNPVVDVPLLAFVGWNLVALAFSSDPHQSIFGVTLQHQGVLTLLLYVGYFYAARMVITDTGRLVVLFGAVTVGASAVSLYGIVQALHLDPIWKGYLPSGRVFSTIGQPDALGAYLVVTIALAAALVLGAARSRGRRRMAGLAMAAMVIVLVLSYSRGGYLGVGVVAVVFLAWWAHTHGLRLRPRLVHLAAAVGLVAVVVAVPGTRATAERAWDRALSVSQVNGDKSINNHLDQWKVAVKIVETHPLVGTGPETFPQQFPSYSRLVLPPPAVRYFDQFSVESPHDEVLAIAAGSGIPAAVAYLAFLAGVLYAMGRALARRRPATTRLVAMALIAVVAGHFVTDSFMTAEITGSWLFWLLMGAGVAVALSLPAAADDSAGHAGDPHRKLMSSR